MKPKTVTVRAAQTHTYEGKQYKTGQQYAVPEELVDSLVVQGKAMRAAEAPTKARKSTAKKAKAKATYNRRDMRAKKK